MKKTNQQIFLLSITSFFTQMIISMVNLAMVYYLRDIFNISSSKIALATSSFSIAYCVACLSFGKISKNFKPRNLILLSLLGMSVSIFLVTLTNSFTLVIVCLIFYGGFLSFMWPQVEGWLSRGKEKEELNYTMSKFNLSWSFGMAFSSVLCGLLIGISSPFPLYVATISLLLIALNLFIVTTRIPELRAVESEKEYILKAGVKDNSTFLRFYCWIGVVIGYFVLGAICNIFPLYARENLGYSETAIGLLLWLRGFVSCFVFFYLGKRSFWHFKKNLIFISQFTIGLLCFLFRNSQSFLSLSLFFLSFGFLFPFVYMQSMFHGASGAINRTNRMLIHEVLLTGGLVFGSILGGLLFDHFSYPQMMVVFSIFIITCVILEIIISLGLHLMKEKNLIFKKILNN